MLPLVRSDLFRFSRWLTPYVLLAIIVAFLALIYCVDWIQVSNASKLSPSQVADLRDQVRLDNVPATTMSVVQGIGSILGVVLAGMAIGGEYSSGTIRTMLPRSSSRWAYLSGKLIAIVLFVPVMIVVGLAVGLASSLAVSAFLNLDTSMGPHFLLRAVGAMGVAGYVMLPSLAFAVLAAVWTRSTGVGIGVGLGVSLLENIISSILQQTDSLMWLRDSLPAINAAAVLRAADTSLGPSNAPDPWRGAAVLAAYVLASLALAFWLFLRRDVRVGTAS